MDFVTEDHPPVKTANQGTLSMLGCRTCIVELKLGKDTHRIILKDCLHAPSALLNLLSVSRMLLQGWGCDFRGTTSSSGPSCQLSYKGNVLGDLVMTNNLCYVPLHFIAPSNSPLLRCSRKFLHQLYLLFPTCCSIGICGMHTWAILVATL